VEEIVIVTVVVEAQEAVEKALFEVLPHSQHLLMELMV
jgi:hypothetical protein